MKPISIIIPTWSNEEFLNPCVASIINNGILNEFAELIIVNNGKQDIKRTFGWHPGIRIIEAGRNLGWEGGLELGMKESKSPFVVFQNDDTFLLPTAYNFYQKLLMHFHNDNVAAVAPVTTVAAGMQSIYHPGCPRLPTEASYLIFFTVMVRRSHYDAVGGIDTKLPGGDDFDLSMRFRQAGYNILIDPGAFLIHHGFKSGTRLKGDHTTKGGWNSIEMSDRTNQYLIRKHGFKNWWKTVSGLNYSHEQQAPKDLEGDLVRSFINGEKNILELGCGATKTVDKAIGIDRVPKGQPIPHLHGALSVADIVANIDEPLPVEENSQDSIIARHILEHIHNSVRTIKNWKKVLRPGGKLIIAVPDEKVTRSIPLNPEHCSVYTQESLKDLMEACGFKEIKSESSNNGVSFVGCYERMN